MLRRNLRRGTSRTRHAQVLHLQVVLLRGRRRQVGKIKAGFALGALQQPRRVQFGLQEVGEYGNGGHGGEVGGQLGDGAPGESQRLIAESPVVKLDGVEGAEAVDALKVIRWHLET